MTIRSAKPAIIRAGVHCALRAVWSWISVVAIDCGMGQCISDSQLAKMKKSISGMHVPATKLIGMKQLVWKVTNILEKIRFLWKCEIWGNIVKIWYFVNITAYWIEARIKTSFAHVWHIIYNCDYLKHSTFRFNLIDFQLNTDFPSQFYVLYRKIT